MDVDYARNDPDPDVAPFEQALSVLATVMSVRGERDTTDAGTKAQSTDSGPAQPWFVVVEGDRVVEVWPIEARGAFF